MFILGSTSGEPNLSHWLKRNGDDGNGDEIKAMGVGWIVSGALQSFRRKAGPEWKASGHLGEKSGLLPSATRKSRKWSSHRPWVSKE